mgnify:CR=1 FL=1
MVCNGCYKSSSEFGSHFYSKWEQNKQFKCGELSSAEYKLFRFNEV